jgi:protein gp37
VNKTKIDWCTHTVNPVVGCTYGCTYCYARRLNNRFKWIEDWNKPQFYPKRLEELKSKRPKIIFMNSMSDIADWEEGWIQATFKAIEENPQHIYLFLTKRLKEAYRDIKYPTNIWLGNTITRQKDFIREYGRPLGANRFYSIEPILEPIRIPQMNIPKWVIVGAETGNRKGKVIPKKEWIMDIKEQCRNAGVPLFMKESLRKLMGQEFVQEFPWDRRND